MVAPGHSPQVIQCVPGDWDLEIKTREQLGQTSGISHGLWIVLKPTPSASMDRQGYGYLAYTFHGYPGCPSSDVKHQVFLGYVQCDMPGDTCLLPLQPKGRRIFGT